MNDADRSLLDLTPSSPGRMTVVAASADELADAHPIAADRVSTQRILKADGARIMLLAFDTGQQLKEHSAPVPLLVQCVSGRLRFECDGETLELQPGSLVHVDARLPHAVFALEPSRLQLTLLD